LSPGADPAGERVSANGPARLDMWGRLSPAEDGTGRGLTPEILAGVVDLFSVAECGRMMAKPIESRAAGTTRAIPARLPR